MTHVTMEQALMWKFRTNQSNFCYVANLHRPRLKIFLCDTLECKDLYWKERLETPSTPKFGTFVSFKVIHIIFLKSIGRGWSPLHKGYSHFIFIYKVTFYFKIFLLLFFTISNEIFVYYLYTRIISSYYCFIMWYFNNCYFLIVKLYRMIWFIISKTMDNINRLFKRFPMQFHKITTN